MLRKYGLLISKANLMLLIFVLSSFLLGQAALAEGDGSGGGKSDPLTLVSSTVTNGATGVSIKPVIKLTFNKNIVNMSVRDNNLTCFSLQTVAGTIVPIDVTLADDQTPDGFEARNDAVITPKANLEQGTVYSVVISASLRSKSGVTTGTETRINFTTAGVKPAANTNVAVAATPQQPNSTTTPKAAAPTNNAATVTNKVTESPTTAQQTTDSQTKSTDVNTAPQQQTNTNNEKKKTVSAAKVEKQKSVKEGNTAKGSDKSQAGIYLIFIIVIMIAILVYFYVIKKKRKILKK